MAGLAMDQNDLFGMALGLSAPWKVVRSGFEEADAGSKFLYVDHDGGYRAGETHLQRLRQCDCG